VLQYGKPDEPYYSVREDRYADKMGRKKSSAKSLKEGEIYDECEPGEPAQNEGSEFIEIYNVTDDLPEVHVKGTELESSGYYELTDEVNSDQFACSGIYHELMNPDSHPQSEHQTIYYEPANEEDGPTYDVTPDGDTSESTTRRRGISVDSVYYQPTAIQRSPMRAPVVPGNSPDKSNSAPINAHLYDSVPEKNVTPKPQRNEEKIYEEAFPVHSVSS